MKNMSQTLEHTEENIVRPRRKWRPRIPRGDDLQLMLTFIGAVVAVGVGACAAVISCSQLVRLGVCVTRVARSEGGQPAVPLRLVHAVKMPGELFLNALQMLVVPFMFVLFSFQSIFCSMSSMIMVMVNLGQKSAGKVW
jgi:hypothetical protein